MISKSEFVRSTGLKREEFEIEGLGTVNMRELSVAERLELTERYKDRHEYEQSLAMTALSVCEPDGSSMFGLDDLDEGVAVMKGKAHGIVEGLQRAFLRVNGLDEAAIEKAVGNSTEIPSVPSSTVSPGISDTQASQPSQEL